MKKFLYSFLFTSGYSVFLSLGIECLLILLSFTVSVSPDGSSSAKLFSAFIPLCLVLGAFALAAIIILAVFNLKTSEKFNYTRATWYVQTVSAIVVSIPMIKLWELLREFLQQAL